MLHTEHNFQAFHHELEVLDHYRQRFALEPGEHVELPDYPLPAYIPVQWHDRVKVIMDDRGVHFLWTGWNNGKGHGKASIAGKVVYCYRWVWEQVAGEPIPVGHVIDHTCERKACINFDCLEPVTMGVNTYRGPGRHHQFRRAEEYA